MGQHELSKLKPQTAWASIPCGEVSPAHEVNRQMPATTLRKVRIVKALFNKWAARAPKFSGIIENPGKGLSTLNPFPRYVQPTSLWFARPLPAFDARYCGAAGRCPFAYKGPCGRFRHPQTAQRGRLSITNVVGTQRLAERFRVPHRLVYALIRAAKFQGTTVDAALKANSCCSCRRNMMAYTITSRAAAAIYILSHASSLARSVFAIPDGSMFV